MDTLTIVLIAGFSFLTGAAVVGLIWYLKGVSGRMGGNSKNNAINDPELSEVARLLRHLQTQELVVGMDGKAFTTASELTPAQQRRILFTSKVLVKWLEQVPGAPEAADEPLTESIPSPQESSEPVETTPAETQYGYIPPFMDEPAEEVKPVSTDLPDMMGGFLNPPTQTAGPGFSSIAMQINEILQDQLAGTDLETRGITLNDGPDRGVMVTLDGKQYNGVMDVPEEKVRNAIRAAVVEWETRK